MLIELQRPPTSANDLVTHEVATGAGGDLVGKPFADR